MNKRGIKLIFKFLGMASFLFFVFTPSIAKAANSTLRGSAYWGDYGYVYFNCLDDVTGNFLDEPHNLAGGTSFVEPWWDGKDEFHLSYDSCDENGYHKVELSSLGALIGKAWSPMVGFINFDYDGVNMPPGNAFHPKCLEICGPEEDCLACYSYDDQKLYGWARIEIEGDRLSGTNEKWILLDADYTDKEASIYTHDGSSNYFGLNLDLGDFAGSAKSIYGNQELSFNCATENYPDELGSETCNTRNYKVYIKDLNIGRLSAPNWSYTRACREVGAARGATLMWEKFSGTQAAYEVLVRKKRVGETAATELIPDDIIAENNSNPSSDVIHFEKRSGIAQSVTIAADKLEYGTAYYWWVRGFDEEGKATGWIRYNTNSYLDTDGDPDGDPLTFHTFRNEFPIPYFLWEPDGEDALTSEGVTFTSTSFAFQSSRPSDILTCANYPGLCSFEWSTSDTGASIASSTEAQTDIFFGAPANTTITLKVTDGSNYYCSTSTVLRINYDLPLWREVRVEDY